jgi:hypothetical protein
VPRCTISYRVRDRRLDATPATSQEGCAQSGKLRRRRRCGERHLDDRVVGTRNPGDFMLETREHKRRDAARSGHLERAAYPIARSSE